MIKLILIISFLCFLTAHDSAEKNILTIIGTTNVHGEIDPCG